MNTLLLDPAAWDFLIDAAGNIAMAENPYSQAQDAASAIKTFQGECFYDTDLGVPYWQNILGQAPPLSLIKAEVNAQALTVPGVATAVTFIQSFVNRHLTGQVQLINDQGQNAAAGF